MSRLSEATKKQMHDHAVEVIEVQTENREREAKGISPDTTRICNLYDISDWMFSADRVKSLLDELTEVYAQLTGYKAAMNDFHRLTRDLDVLLNGENAAQQASLCDIVAQVQSEALKSPNHPDATEPVADVVAWHKEGEERTCDIRWRRHDVAPGPLYAVPQPELKDHQIRELVNELRDIAIEYHGAQQLRERIARAVRTALNHQRLS